MYYLMMGFITLMVPIPNCPYEHDTFRSWGVTMNSFIDLESGYGV